MTKIKEESKLIKNSILERIQNGRDYPYLYSVIQFGFYDNQGFLLPPSVIRQYWDRTEVERTCKLIYNLLKENCKIKELYFFIERHAPKSTSIITGKEIQGRFHLNIISSLIKDDVIERPDRKMRRLMTDDSRIGIPIRRTNYENKKDMKIDLFNACCKRARWVNRYKYSIQTQYLYEPTDLKNTVFYCLKDYQDKSDIDFMDLVVFKASDYEKQEVLV
tara:strand:+ start:4600 stop:5256 length:657 start_codon:yes stop_codon:yes gene_type:complete